MPARNVPKKIAALRGRSSVGVGCVVAGTVFSGFQGIFTCIHRLISLSIHHNGNSTPSLMMGLRAAAQPLGMLLPVMVPVSWADGLSFAIGETTNGIGVW